VIVNMHGRTTIKIGIGKFTADPTTRGTTSSGGLHKYGILKFVMCSFGLDSVLRTDVRILDPCYGIWE
jgi:hypothetical protein